MARRRTVVDQWRPWALLDKEQIEKSPSFELGMSFKAEKKIREAACKAIGEAGKALEQGIMTIATAQAYFMRFFALKAYQMNDSFIIAVAALFVASKTENKPRALADIAHACWRQWVDAWVKEQKRRHKDRPASYWDQKAAAEKQQFRNPEFARRLAEAATTAERVLLYTTGFQFNILTAFSALAGCKGRLKLHPDPVVSKFFDELPLQVVWNFVIECYSRTRQCLQFDPRTIGIACYEMTCSHLGKEIPLVEGDVWWRHIGKAEGWDASIGRAEDVKTIQDELWTIFQPQPKLAGGAANGVALRADGQASQPGTPLQPGALLATPGASPITSAAAISQPTPGSSGNATPAQANGAGSSELRETKTNGPSSGPIPVPAVEAAERPAVAETAPPAAAQAAPAQVKQREGPSSVHFSPSDEFIASPRGTAPDDSAQTSAPSLLGLESGELVLEPAAPASQDEEKRKARLAKVRAAMLEKRKPEAVSANGEPEAKKRRSPAELTQFEP